MPRGQPTGTAATLSCPREGLELTRGGTPTPLSAHYRENITSASMSMSPHEEEEEEEEEDPAMNEASPLVRTSRLSLGEESRRSIRRMSAVGVGAGEGEEARGF